MPRLPPAESSRFALKHEKRLVLARETRQRRLHNLLKLRVRVAHVRIDRLVAERSEPIRILRPRHADDVAAVRRQHRAREARRRLRVHEQQHGVGAASNCRPREVACAVAADRVADPGRAPEAVAVVDGVHGEVELAEEVRPVAVAGAEFYDCFGGRGRCCFCFCF